MTLRWEQVRIEAGPRTLLDTTDLEVEPGQVLAVVGPSGSGKTTTLLAVAGLSQPAGGRLLLDGVETWRADRRTIGVVTQPVLLASSLTVAENISLPMQTLGRPARESRARVTELMAALSLAGVSDREPTRLSGGQRQRVAVARAVAAEPSLIVADEPTSELDHDSRELVVAILRRAAARSCVVVLSTHDDEVASRCDRVLTLG